VLLDDLGRVDAWLGDGLEERVARTKLRDAVQKVVDRPVAV
jgi:hypothetical protein